MKLPRYFISCDWGTSTLRLRHVRTETLEVLAEHRSDMGVKRWNRAFGEQHTRDRSRFFGDYLIGQIEALGLDPMEPQIVVGSGMLTSSIGMRELEYGTVPLTFDGNELRFQSMDMDTPTTLILISGIKTDSDVMRGEEVQAIGLADHFPKKGKGILILPGTHSKHIQFTLGRFTDFRTYMTGELFEMIHTQSILKASLRSADWESRFETPFLNGVSKGAAGSLMATLFEIRANHLLYHVAEDETYYYLSGLLIGSELADLKHNNNSIWLGATGIQRMLYSLALGALLPKGRLTVFGDLDVDQALLKGQRKMLKSAVALRS